MCFEDTVRDKSFVLRGCSTAIAAWHQASPQRATQPSQKAIEYELLSRLKEVCVAFFWWILLWVGRFYSSGTLFPIKCVGIGAE